MCWFGDTPVEPVGTPANPVAHGVKRMLAIQSAQGITAAPTVAPTEAPTEAPTVAPTPAPQCTCAYGTPATGNACTTDGEEVCESCVAGYNLQGSTCNLNQCVCPNGAGTTGTACPTHGSHVCNQCGPGYGLSGLLCEICEAVDYEFSQALDNSACADHTRCSAGHGSNWGSLADSTREASSCTPCVAGTSYSDAEDYGPCTPVTTCGDGEYVQTPASATADGVCALKVCVCSNGVGQTGVFCPVHGQEVCASCVSGHILDLQTSTCVFVGFGTPSPTPPPPPPPPFGFPPPPPFSSNFRRADAGTVAKEAAEKARMHENHNKMRRDEFGGTGAEDTVKEVSTKQLQRRRRSAPTRRLRPRKRRRPRPTNRPYHRSTSLKTASSTITNGRPRNRLDLTCRTPSSPCSTPTRTG